MSAVIGAETRGSHTDPAELLRSRFGFSAFRPNQEAVCREAIGGQDVLLVMPTGSGKSLCYQLPGIARGGTTLVISPLIALMEDQTAKLRALGLAVEAIHSGRPREASRQACREYLAGRLQFLFIAPERLRVPGFPEFLARKRPSLIAIDEAHCISQWGHDFRPDYRRLGQHLPALRPAPVIALTATATPRVQNDICEQLRLHQPSRFIHGFRRENLAIEIVEVAPRLRLPLVQELLLDTERRPAIVYTPTRKQAEELASVLASHFPAAAYHARLDADHRRHVQQRFLCGRLEVMVATIAFGMGVDKPDVRTVIHTALPGSIEAYYQEVGRAGRDGKPSRAVLMHSWPDRLRHDFFFERDYPEIEVLDRLFGCLKAEPQERAALQRQAQMDSDTFDKVLEKLWIHGGAIVDFDEKASRGGESWRISYAAQGEQKQAQIEEMMRYAENSRCRMRALVGHFGDTADSSRSCGMCDFCAPDRCIAQRFRTATRAERDMLFRVLAALRSGYSRASGKLHLELCPGREMSRDDFEEVLGGMARAGLLDIENCEFEKEGKRIPFRRVHITLQGRSARESTPLNFVLKADVAEPGGPVRNRNLALEAGRKARGRENSRADSSRDEVPVDPAVEGALRAWRLNEARSCGVPAFRILTDRVLRAIAGERPESLAALLGISGIGPRTVEKYGREILRLAGGGKAETTGGDP